jgi:hypothetical protein
MVRRIRRNKLRALKLGKGNVFHLHIPTFRESVLDELGNTILKHAMGYCILCGRAMKAAKPKPTAFAVAG